MPRLCIVTALPAETRPLLDALKLRQLRTRHLRLYGAEQYLLLETGPGKLNAAASTGAIMQAHPDIGCIVNIGIAGGHFNYGQAVAAHHVRDAASGAQWYPHLPDSKEFRTVRSASISTLDVPDTCYRDGVLFDMEAAGIFHAASRYLSTSLMQSIKVVSDNAEHGLGEISKNSVIELITLALPDILPMLEGFMQLSSTMHQQHAEAIDALLDNTLDRVRHTVNDEQILRHLLNRHVALTGSLPDIDSRFESAKAIRHALRTRLATQPLIYGDT